MAPDEHLKKAIEQPTVETMRTEGSESEQICLDDKGLLEFSPDDPENPKNWSTGRRWYVTVVAITLVVNATFASSSPSGALKGIAEEFQVSSVAANLVTSLFLCGYVAGPLLFAPLSEFYGRRYIFYIAMVGYFAFNFLCAFTPTFAGLLVGRFLTGTFASAPMSNAPGVLADLWGPVERGNAMALFSMMTFAGPSLGPVVAGFLELKENWRWSFYVLIWLAAWTILLMLTLPETLAPQILTMKAKRIRKAKIPGYEDVKSPAEAANRTLAGIYKVALTRPWIVLFDPIALLVAIYLSIVYALFYMLFTIYPIVFQMQRQWNAGVGELPLIGSMLGAYLGGAIVYYDSTKQKKKVLSGTQMTPEDRLPLAMLGGVMFPVMMFFFAWTANFNSIHWFVPTLAGSLLATSIMLIFVSYLNYLTDTYLLFAASAIAGNTIARSACGAAAPLFAEQMFTSLGVGPAGSIIGGVACLLAPIPYVFYRYGRKIREKSKFAPTETPKSKEHSNASEEKLESQAGEGRGESGEGETPLELDAPKSPEKNSLRSGGSFVSARENRLSYLDAQVPRDSYFNAREVRISQTNAPETRDVYWNAHETYGWDMV